MSVVFWDSSALAKQYIPEAGSETVEAVLESKQVRMHFLARPAYAELYWVFSKALNRATISQKTYENALARLWADWYSLDNRTLLTVDDATIDTSLPLIHAHTINSSDAAFLRRYLDYASRNTFEKFVIVVCDGNFIRASKSEGLVVINPLVTTPGEAVALLSL